MVIATGSRSNKCTTILYVLLWNSAPAPHALTKSSGIGFTPALVVKLFWQCVLSTQIEDFRGDKIEDVKQVAN